MQQHLIVILLIFIGASSLLSGPKKIVDRAEKNERPTAAYIGGMVGLLIKVATVFVAAWMIGW